MGRESFLSHDKSHIKLVSEFFSQFTFQLFYEWTPKLKKNNNSQGFKKFMNGYKGDVV